MVADYCDIMSTTATPTHCVFDCSALGVCLGFFFMSNFESPETLFSIIMQRREVAPAAVIYDYACGGHSYAMNRSFAVSAFATPAFLIKWYLW